MRPDLLDEIPENREFQKILEKGDDVTTKMHKGIAIECAEIKIQEEWNIKPEGEDPFKSVGYDGIKNFIESKISPDVQARALKVLEDLFYLNSPIEVIKNRKKTKFLLRTTPSKNISPNLIIDLCHENTDILFEEIDEDIRESVKSDFPKCIDCIGYSLFGLKDIEDALSIIKKVNRQRIIEKGESIAVGYSLLGEKIHWTIMSLLFHGRHNCTCNMSYESNANLCNSILPYHVFCYECLKYIKEEKDCRIETKMDLNQFKGFENVDDNKEIAMFSCCDLDNPEAEGWPAIRTSVKFLGMFKVDKERSMQERHWAFKLVSDKLTILY